jgi:hypothetical protein
VAAFGRQSNGSSEIELVGLAASPDGKNLIRGWGVGYDPEALGADLASQILSQGAGEFLNG